MGMRTQHTIDDKVRAAELQYWRARAAVLMLRGPGEWEEALRVLTQSDVRALNERELTAQEVENIHRVRVRAGVELDAEEIAAERLLTAVSIVGEGQRTLSWIWFRGNAHERVDDPLTRAGRFRFH